MKKLLALCLIFVLYGLAPQTSAQTREAFTIIRDTDNTLVNDRGLYDTIKVTKAFYRDHPEDQYDFLLIATTFDIPNKPNYVQVWQPETIAGRRAYDTRLGFEIPSQKLRGILHMKNIASLPSGTQDSFLKQDWWYTTSHEFGHQWLVFLQEMYPELARWTDGGGGHWSSNVLLPSTIMSGNQQQYWSREGNTLRLVGTPVEAEANLVFDPLTLYLMGFTCAEDARTTEYWLTDGTQERTARLEGVLNVTELQRIFGARAPNCRTSQKEFRVGLILLETPSHPATSVHTEAMDRLSQWVPVWWHASTQGKSRMDTGIRLPTCNASDYEERLSICQNGKQNRVFLKKQPCLGGDERKLYESISCIVTKVPPKQAPNISSKEQAAWIIDSGRDLPRFLQRLGTAKRLDEQKRWFPITQGLLKTRKPAPTTTLYAVNNYIVYGTKNPLNSPSQRLDRVKKYMTSFKRYPVSQTDWESVIK